MQRQKLTGWLIFFMAWVGIAGVNGLGALEKADQVWRPHMANCPSLQNAVLVFQLFTSAGIFAWLYCAWVLYQREPGTLRRAQMSLLVGAALRLAGGWSIVLFGGLPKETLRAMAQQSGFVTFVVLLFTGAWYYYLLRSERVREIYEG
jgi:hypothetical protein